MDSVTEKVATDHKIQPITLESIQSTTFMHGVVIMNLAAIRDYVRTTKRPQSTAFLGPKAESFWISLMIFVRDLIKFKLQQQILESLHRLNQDFSILQCVLVHPCAY